MIPPTYHLLPVTLTYYLLLDRSIGCWSPSLDPESRVSIHDICDFRLPFFLPLLEFGDSIPCAVPCASTMCTTSTSSSSTTISWTLPGLTSTSRSLTHQAHTRGISFKCKFESKSESESESKSESTCQRYSVLELGTRITRTRTCQCQYHAFVFVCVRVHESRLVPVLPVVSTSGS